MKGAWTERAALPGGDIPDANFSLFLQELRRRHPWLPHDVALGYARRYGTRVESLLNGAKSISDLGRPFGGTLYEREARFLSEEEWATDAEDILERRTKHALAPYPKGARRFYDLVSNADAAARLMTSTHIDDSEFQALRKLSAALGADPLRTQGAGGNTSIKRDGVMWIKASGTWLADALAHDIMTPVRLEPLRKAIADGDPRAAAATDFVDSGANFSGLRPSIETSVHAIMPSPIVVHIHCVNTIALAVRGDGEALARERLRSDADIALAFAPYRKPGLPLAHAIAERLAKDTNVFVLANHGLVVAGDTVAEVADSH